MVEVEVNIDGRKYRMVCNPGEEERILSIGNRFSSFVRELRQKFGEIGEQQITFMAAMLVTEQLAETEHKLEKLETEMQESSKAEENLVRQFQAQEELVATKVNEAAEKIESIVFGLNQDSHKEQEISE